MNRYQITGIIYIHIRETDRLTDRDRETETETERQTETETETETERQTDTDRDMYRDKGSLSDFFTDTLYYSHSRRPFPQD